MAEIKDFAREKRRRLSHEMDELLCSECGSRFAIFQSCDEDDEETWWVRRIQCLNPDCGAYIDFEEEDGEVEFKLE